MFDSFDPLILDALRRNGIVVVPGLSKSDIGECSSYLRGTSCYTEHVKVYSDAIARSFEDSEKLTDVWCHEMTDVVMAPNFFELTLKYASIAADYLDTSPFMYSMNAFWTKTSSNAPKMDLQTWHRDHDDERFLALFVYGTDVFTEADGPHQFKVGTHNGAEDGEIRTMYGPAGTAFLADTRGLHMGRKPTRLGCRRLLLWARWSVSVRPWAYDNDKLAPVAATLLGDRYSTDPVVRNQIRLVVA